MNFFIRQLLQILNIFTINVSGVRLALFEIYKFIFIKKMNNLMTIRSRNCLIKFYRLLTSWHIIIGTKIKLIIINFFVNKENMVANRIERIVKCCFKVTIFFKYRQNNFQKIIIWTSTNQCVNTIVSWRVK